jgi:Mycothiol maleylpyruvate isomerase N-terminal domain
MSDHEANGSDPQHPRELIERTEQSWRAWVDAVEGIPEARMAEPAVGHWSVKDLLGHVAFWEDWVIGHCQRILANEPEPASEEELEAMNQSQVAESKGASVDDQKRYRDDAHARLASFLTTIPDGEPRFPRLVEALEWETYKHYDDHAQQVRAWRQANAL